jgi:starch-binding outer membrane protein, SusD/RagB family
MKPSFNSKSAGLLLIILVALSNCTKLVEVPNPITSTTAEIIYSSDASAISVLTGIYAEMSNMQVPLSADIKSTPFFLGLAADELTLLNNSSLTNQYYHANSLRSEMDAHFWIGLYQRLFKINLAIEGLTAATQLTLSIKQQLLGEAKFMRAYCYFYLANLYGDVPLLLTSDYLANSNVARTNEQEVYKQIVIDLTEAKSLLSSEYLNVDLLTVSSERVRPNTFTASALLSRCYLYLQEYQKAEDEASVILDNTAMYELESLQTAFLIESRETIWSLFAVGADNSSNSEEGRVFILPESGPGSGHPVILSDHVMSAFEPGDLRMQHWTQALTIDVNTYNYPYKYKIGDVSAPYTEYSVMFRLAEQYLIRAEARIQMNEIEDGIMDLNTIRLRSTDINAPLPNQLPQLSANLSQPDALLAVEHERQVELFTEAGHRWFDLKRTGRLDAVLGSIKGTNWQSTDQWMPIPQNEMNRNPGLAGQQNEGY